MQKVSALHKHTILMFAYCNRIETIFFSIAPHMQGIRCSRVAMLLFAISSTLPHVLAGLPKQHLNHPAVSPWRNSRAERGCDDPVWKGKGFHEHQSCQFLRQDWSSDIKKDYYIHIYVSSIYWPLLQIHHIKRKRRHHVCKRNEKNGVGASFKQNNKLICLLMIGMMPCCPCWLSSIHGSLVSHSGSQ